VDTYYSKLDLKLLNYFCITALYKYLNYYLVVKNMKAWIVQEGEDRRNIQELDGELVFVDWERLSYEDFLELMKKLRAEGYSQRLIFTHGISGVSYWKWYWKDGSGFWLNRGGIKYISKGLIYVFRDGTVSDVDARRAVSHMKQYLEEEWPDLDDFFTIIYYGPEKSMLEELHQALVPYRGSLAIDFDKLGSIVTEESYRKEVPHVDVLISRRRISDETAIWGASSFLYGLCIIRNTGEIPVRHEFTHCPLGYHIHHDTALIKAYGTYSGDYNAECLMWWAGNSPRPCPKCRDGIEAFWEGLKERGLVKI